jgi:3-hydroxymyristoyl/3-hydroxydecanoyl-(acyl carrier protein) dehydratase
MTGLTREGDSLVSHFLFSDDFIGFQGHFPGRKVLPGVCQVQCVLTTLEKAYKRGAGLKEIVLAKYLAPALPGEELTCRCMEAGEQDGDHLIKAVMMKKDAKIAEFKLRLRFA